MLIAFLLHIILAQWSNLQLQDEKHLPADGDCGANGFTLLHVCRSRRSTSSEIAEIQSDSFRWSRRSRAWNRCLVLPRWNIGSFPASASEPPNFTLVQVILHRRDGSDFHMHYLQRKRDGVGWGQGRSIKTLLAPGNYPEVGVEPRWWNVLMFMHMKGITHSNSPTTISLQCCVIINGLECIENSHHFFFPILFAGTLPSCMCLAYLSWK